MWPASSSQRLASRLRGAWTPCATQLRHMCEASTTAAQPTSTAEDAPGPSLTPEQQQHLEAFRYLASRPLRMALAAASLAAATATFRDLYVTMDQVHKKDILGVVRPLLESPPLAAAAGSSGGGSGGDPGAAAAPPPLARTQSFYPIRDLTLLPDKLMAGPQLQPRFMDRITAFAALLPNHVEVSYQMLSGVYMWPVMEAYYPFYVDFDAIEARLRRLAKRPRTGSRRRPKPKRRLLAYPTTLSMGGGRAGQRAARARQSGGGRGGASGVTA